MEENNSAEGGGVSLWKHRHESLLRNNRPAREEEPQVSTKSFSNGEGSKGLTLKLSLKIFNGENDWKRSISKTCCRVIEKRKNVKTLVD